MSTMSNIRVTYSGLISFTVGLISVFTGLVFLTIVTRSLSIEEYGTWGLLLNLLILYVFLQIKKNMILYKYYNYVN